MSSFLICLYDLFPIAGFPSRAYMVHNSGVSLSFDDQVLANGGDRGHNFDRRTVVSMENRRDLIEVETARQQYSNSCAFQYDLLAWRISIRRS